MADTDPDLRRLADDLSTTLSDLRDELDARPRPPRGPLGLPRPPTPREFLRFTDEFAVPAIIAVLEANIRALEAFQGALRLARAGDEMRGHGEDVRARTAALGRGTLSRLDDALVDLEGALDGQPQNAEARTLLDDARALRAEIDDRLRETDRRSNGQESSRDARNDGSDPWRSNDELRDLDEGVTIDVDAELDSIHDAIDEEGGDDGDEDEDR